ncbi:MAG: hypothetical protein U0N62_11360, partial [Hydrogeniiclostridium sp.]
MKRKNGKKSLFTGGALALALALLMTIGLLPAVPAQAATETVDMRISYQLDGVSSVGKGMPFGATFYFAFLDGNAKGALENNISTAKVTVSASGIALSKKSFDLQECEIDELPEGIATTYNSPTHCVYIPEQYMTNTGRSVATLKFTITWESSSTNYRATGQKTITECQLDEGATSE